METKTKSNQAQAIVITLDLGEYDEDYDISSVYEALENHCRQNKDIQRISDYDGASRVEITYLTDTDEDTAIVRDASQFGVVVDKYMKNT